MNKLLDTKLWEGKKKCWQVIRRRPPGLHALPHVTWNSLCRTALQIKGSNFFSPLAWLTAMFVQPPSSVMAIYHQQGVCMTLHSMPVFLLPSLIIAFACSFSCQTLPFFVCVCFFLFFFFFFWGGGGVISIHVIWIFYQNMCVCVCVWTTTA